MLSTQQSHAPLVVVNYALESTKVTAARLTYRRSDIVCLIPRSNGPAKSTLDDFGVEGRGQVVARRTPDTCGVVRIPRGLV